MGLYPRDVMPLLGGSLGEKRSSSCFLDESLELSTSRPLASALPPARQVTCDTHPWTCAKALCRLPATPSDPHPLGHGPPSLCFSLPGPLPRAPPSAAVAPAPDGPLCLAAGHQQVGAGLRDGSGRGQHTRSPPGAGVGHPPEGEITPYQGGHSSPGRPGVRASGAARVTWVTGRDSWPHGPGPALHPGDWLPRWRLYGRVMRTAVSVNILHADPPTLSGWAWGGGWRVNTPSSPGGQTQTRVCPSLWFLLR